MKRSFGISLVLLFWLFFLPWIWSGEGMDGKEVTEQIPPEQGAASSDRERRDDSTRRIRVQLGEQVEEMALSDYLVGVLRCEMPASFEMEALKAQAVAARTYALRKQEAGGSANHPEADVCDDVNCCKGYRSEAEAAEQWGMATALYEEKMRAAVTDTDGEVLLYADELVLAVFHSSSAGETRAAGAVWQEDLPYLVPVSSPEGAEDVPNYHSEVRLTLTEFKERFIASHPTAALSGAPSDWFTNIRQGATGIVDRLQVGGVEVTGVEMRSLLGLRSAAFTVDFTESEVVFSVTGYGHGVGMSQYGANVMAKEGSTYEEILAHYYVGTSIAVYGA